MPSIAIIGAGIGGLCTAHGLRRAGFDVRVFEKAPELAPVGAGLTLWLNALRCLDALGLGDDFRQLAPATFAQMIDWRGRPLSRLDAEQLKEAFGFPAHTVHRADLHSLLLEAVGPQHVSLDAELASGDQDDDHVLLGFANGNEQRFDLVIAADGIDSVARKIFLPRSPAPRFAGYLSWRGVAPMAAEELPGGYAFEAWGPGCRFGALPLVDDRIYWFATENAAQGSPAPAAQRQHLLNVFGDWLRPIPQLLEVTPEANLLRHDIYDLPDLPTWSRGRVVLLGDAAHATTPNMGQGACQAIEDSVVLARELSKDPTQGAFARFEAARRRRTRQIVRMSRRIGAMGQLENPVLCWLRNAVLRSTPPSLALRQMKDLLSFDPTAGG